MFLVLIILVFSFILHIIIFAILYRLYREIQQLKKSNPEDIVELLELYLEEIKEENQQLKEEISVSTDTSEEIEGMNSKTAETKSTLPLVDNEIYDDTLLPTNKDDHVEASIEAKMLNLYQQNMDTTEIARILDCGKTEVDLVIKLYAKRNEMLDR